MGLVVIHHLIPLSIISGCGAIGLFVGVGTVEVWNAATGKPASYSMELVELVHVYGKGFGQEIRIIGTNKPIRATWTAEIERNTQPLCGGTGSNLYEPAPNDKIKFFSADDWTAAECPELQKGDIGRAVWEYTTVNGFNASIWGEVVLK